MSSWEWEMAQRITSHSQNKKRARFEKRGMHLLGSSIRRNLHSNPNSIKYMIISYLMIMGLVLPWFGADMVTSNMLMRTWPKPTFQCICFLIIEVVYIITSILIFNYDLDALECYFGRNSKSVYYLATGVPKKRMIKDRGLIGEYRAYILSRKLKVPHKILFNVCVPMPNGNFQEVDAVLITRNIIYVLECKNRGGSFVGSYDSEQWMQYIGSQQHPSENIYMQNQKHTMAIDQFLLDRGVIENGENVCLNVVLTNGIMRFPDEDQPLDFLFGDTKHITKFIEKNDGFFDDGTDTSGIMNQVYELLLPYALYNDQERAIMMEERERRSENKEFVAGPFQKKVIHGGIPGITDPQESTVIRYNRVYTQLQISNGKGTCWQTRTDIPNKYKY